MRTSFGERLATGVHAALGIMPVTVDRIDPNGRLPRDMVPMSQDVTRAYLRVCQRESVGQWAWVSERVLAREFVRSPGTDAQRELERVFRQIGRARRGYVLACILTLGLWWVFSHLLQAVGGRTIPTTRGTSPRVGESLHPELRCLMQALFDQLLYADAFTCAARVPAGESPSSGRTEYFYRMSPGFASCVSRLQDEEEAA